MTAQTVVSCPFCGSRTGIFINLLSDRSLRWICAGCDALGPPTATEAAAIRAWNRRSTSAVTPQPDNPCRRAAPPASPATPISWDEPEETW